MAAESAKRIESAKAAEAAKQAPVKDKAAPPANVPADKVDAPAPSDVVSATEADADKAKAPETVEEADLSFLPEAVRSQVKVSSVQAAAALKSGWMAHSEATKRFTEAKAMERDATNYRDLVADPELAEIVTKAVMDKRAGRKPLAPVAEPDPEIDPFDPKSVASFVSKQVETKVSEARAADQAERERPNEVKAAVNEALNAYQLDRAIDPAIFVEAVKMADAALVKNRRVWDPETVDVLIEPYVALASAAKAKQVTEAVNKADTKNGRSGTAEAASPTGLGGPHTAHVIPLPAHLATGKPPKAITDEMREQELLYAMRRRYGPGVTLEDVRAATG